MGKCDSFTRQYISSPWGQSQGLIPLPVQIYLIYSNNFKYRFTTHSFAYNGVLLRTTRGTFVNSCDKQGPKKRITKRFANNKTVLWVKCKKKHILTILTQVVVKCQVNEKLSKSVHSQVTVENMAENRLLHYSSL